MTEERSASGPIGPGRPSVASHVRRSGAAESADNGQARKLAERGIPHSRWPQYVQYLVVAGVTALFLLLAADMQRHHFFTGEHAKFESADRSGDQAADPSPDR